MIHRVLEWLFPPKCILCRDILAKEETDLCRRCRTDQPEYHYGKKKVPHVGDLTAVWRYEGQVRKSLHRYKFGSARHYAAAYGRLLAMKLRQQDPEGFEVLTWIPVSRLRKIRRGYDQVELLARAVGRELDMEPVSALKKVRHNRQQSRIVEPARRRANVLGVYQVTEPELVRGKRVLLLDDILTTGATAAEAGRVLLTAGAKEVHCAAVAAARKR